MIKVSKVRVLEGLWEFAQPVHMCFVDLEKAFDCVPRGILWGVLHEYGVWGPLLAKGCTDPNRSLVTHCRQTISACTGAVCSRCCPEVAGMRIRTSRIHVLEHGLFAAECEAAGMRISTSKKAEAHPNPRKWFSMGLERVACPLRVGGEVLPQVEEFKYLGVLFTSEGKMEREIDRWIGAASVYWTVVVKKELSRKPEALDLPGGVPGMSHREEASEKTHDTLERLCLSAGLGTPRVPPEELEEVSGRSLHQPMYILFCNLSVNDLIGNTVLLPQLMAHVVSTERFVTYNQCVVQAFYSHTFGSASHMILVIMAIDRYVAIRHPLRYSSIMTTKTVIWLSATAWGVSLLLVSVLIGLTVRLSRCRSFVQNAYCDNASLFKLSCDDVSINNIYGLFFTVLLFSCSIGGIAIT
ncbi:hypothetical protein L3Q82_004907 [Scortum barcoo]|uniref:Uncharacterized protein n=1 Tax=Scortum barcoo TaxID=214431 RepID=A0ACB8VFI1_9TELE|nr:hypothetical protein L3Q82_004907 [Scortum barcoo]